MLFLTLLAPGGCHLLIPYEPDLMDAGVDLALDWSGRDLTTERPGDGPPPPPDIPPDQAPPPPDIPHDVAPPPPDIPHDVAPPPPDMPDMPNDLAPPPPDIPHDKAPPPPDVKLDTPVPPDGAGTTTPVFTWVKRVWSLATDYPLAMAQDSKGNLYLVGYSTGSPLKVDSVALTSTAPGTSSGFIVSFAVDGTVRWMRGLGNDKMAIIQDVAVDSQDNVFVTGYYKGSLKPSNTVKLSSKGSNDIFVTKLKGQTGDHLWSAAFGSTSSDEGLSVAVDSKDNVYVAGTFQSSVILAAKTYTSKGLRDVLLVSYKSGGGFRWAAQAGGSNDDYVHDLAVGGNGHLYFGGQFLKSVDLGGGTIVSNGLTDMYLASYSSAGTYRWSAGFGGKGAESITSVTVVGASSVYALGTFYTSTTLGGKTHTGMGNRDLLLMAYDDTGKHVWSTSYGSKGLETAGGLARDATGNLLVAGSHFNDLNVGGGTLKGTGNDSALFASFTSGGAHRWSTNHRGKASTTLVTGVSVLTDSKGRASFMGQYKGMVSFTVPGNTYHLLSADTDIYVLGTAP